jgi:hypothetical protein
MEESNRRKEVGRMAPTFVAMSKAGEHRDLSRGSREQQFWDEHAAFIDGLVDEGFILMGGLFKDGGAMLVMLADSEEEVREKMAGDPWYLQGMLELISVKRWEIFIDKRAASH